MVIPTATYNILQGKGVFWIHRQVNWFGCILSSKIVGKPFKTLKTAEKVMKKLEEHDYFFVETPGEETSNGCLVPAVLIVLGIIGYILF